MILFLFPSKISLFIHILDRGGLMESLVKLRNYIMDNEFRMTFFENRIHIVNYQELISLGTEKIKIQSPHFQVTLLGENLTLSKLLDQEIMIHGKLIRMEIVYE